MKNELIPVSTNENQEQTVSGRALHAFLEVKTAYKDWFPRMCEYGFTENQDYIAIAQKRATAQGNETTFTDHILKLDMAKEISMLQRTEKGKQARQYFIEVEKKFKQLNKPMTHLEIVAANAIALVEHEKRIQNIEDRQSQTKQQLDAIKDVVVVRPDQTKKWINQNIGKIVKSQGGAPDLYGKIKTETYQLLNQRLGVNVYTRRANKGKIGVSISLIDIILSDKKLTEGYIAIIKEYAIKYGVSEVA